MSVVTVARAQLLVAALSFNAAACSNALETEAADPAESVAALAFDPSALSHGHSRVLVDAINAAENQLFSSAGQLYVSGDDGIFEIVAGPSGSYQSRAVHTGESCQFGGLTEYAGTIYANCYDFSNSWLFAARLGETLEFRSIFELSGTSLANGLSNDGAGNLYVAASFESKILRLRVSPSDPLTITASDTFIDQSGFASNGLKFSAGKLYWTTVTALNVATIRPDGSSGPQRALGSALTVFDDLYVDDRGLIVDDYGNGSLVAADLNGKVLGSTPIGTFDGPSSVQPTQGRLGLPSQALVVTERGGSRLSLFEP